MTVVRAGQIWEFVNATRGTVHEYELEGAEREYQKELSLMRLRNLGTDGIAKVWRDTLAKGDTGSGSSHWRLKRETA